MGPLFGMIDGRGELIAAHVLAVRASWLRRHGEQPEAFEQRIVADMASLGLAA
jgi:hypothetical protein